MNGNSAVLGKRSRAATALVVLIGMVLAMFSVVMSAPAANAAEVDPTLSIDIRNAPPYVTGQQYTVDVAWSVPDSAQAGDTFTVDFPDALMGYASDFDLLDPSNNVVGHCEVTQNQFVCTLSDFVDTHNNVQGTLNFQAQFTQSFDEEQIEFSTGNGATIVTDVEGGVGTTGPGTAPTQPTKFGFANTADKSITWFIRVPSEDLGSGTDPVIEDMYGEGLTFDPAGVGVRWIDVDDWAQSGTDSNWTYIGQGTTPGTYTVTDLAPTRQVNVTLHNPVNDGSRIYDIIIKTDMPDNVQNGDTFGNTATVNGVEYTADDVAYVGSGGDGEGDNLGDLAITKTVTGSGAPQVAGTSYTVNYSYPDGANTVEGQLTFTDGELQTLLDVPEGAVITLSEVAATGTGVVYGTPIFSGTGVTDNGDGTATVTMIDGVIAVGLENPVEQILGGFEVTKTVTGSGAEVVEGLEYTVNYSYTANGTPVNGTLTIADGETDGLDEIPFGTVVTLSEVAPTAPGATFGTPVFEGTGVTDNADGTATVTIGEGTVSVGLTNPVEQILGGFAVTKTVTGTGAEVVEGLEYTVNYSYTANGTPVNDTITVSDGVTVNVPDVPFGTVVTLSEVAPTAAGVTFGTPVFEGTGVVDNGDGTATVTVGEGTVEVGLTNPVEQVLGGFAVTKTVTGTGAEVVEGLEYSVNYSYTANGTPVNGVLTIADGETDGLDAIPFGTVVTLSEVAPTAAGVTFGTPVFEGTGVVDNGDGTATVTVGEGVVSVGLENPAERNFGSLAITKTVTGNGTAKVVDMSYTVVYSYELFGETITDSFDVKNGETETWVFEEGSVVTLSEVKATAPGVTFGTPVFSGEGVTDNGDGTATVVVGNGNTIAVGLENPVTVVPPTTPSTTPPTKTFLASTGADSLPMVIMASLLLLAGATALMARRRRGQA